MYLFFLLFCVVGCNTLAQLLLKVIAMSSGRITAWYWFCIALMCLGLSFFCWLAALRLKPLSFLHPFAALTYIFVPGLAVLIFGESVSGRYLVGIICIVAGICVTSTSVRESDIDEGRKTC